ncbi:MAG: glycosyltransferase family 9 protein [Sedimentisphaerales bacterium]|nr:glycosyltransferase family 9 protein [Sedimentisphaerales bacterium]
MRADDMDPSLYRNRWLRLREGQTNPSELNHLARQVAFSFIDSYFQSGAYVAEYIGLLCEMATFHSKADLNSIASGALFEIIVEKLCDDFEDLPVEVYSRVMCQVISHCRTIPAGRSLDRQLTEFGVTSSDQLYQRAIATHLRQYRCDKRRPPRKILLLSRVTLGADVAILSVMIQHLRRLFPAAEIVIVGSHKLSGLFGGNADVRIRELSYARRGGLFERFASWHATLEVLREEAAGGGEESLLVIDPDSRISQLGVLPLTRGDRYLFLNTRHHMLSANGRCMAEWTNDWMRDVFGTDVFCYPAVWVPDAFRREAGRKVDALRAGGARRIITINLGVGQNPRKRVGLEFEKRLLRTLVAIPGTVILLDSGFGADELERTALLAADLREHGFAAVETSFANMDSAVPSHGVIAVESTIGQMAAMIARSDEYIGYDSACQHIAAATRTPTVTVFAGSNNENFVRRWSACGDTDCRIVHVNTLADPEHVAVDEIISRIMQERASRDYKLHARVREVPAARRRDKPTREPAKNDATEPMARPQ